MGWGSVAAATGVSAVSNYIGGREDRRQDQAQFDAQMSWEQAKQRMEQARWDSEQQMQRDFAKHGVTWNLEQYAKAGINPMYAPGVGGSSYKPAGFTPSGNAQASRSNSGRYIAQMGQDISRALQATMGEKARLELERERLINEGLSIDNDQKRKAQVGPPMPFNNNGPWGSQGDVSENGEVRYVWDPSNNSWVPMPKEMHMTLGAMINEGRWHLRNEKRQFKEALKHGKYYDPFFGEVYERPTWKGIKNQLRWDYHRNKSKLMRGMFGSKRGKNKSKYRFINKGGDVR